MWSLLPEDSAGPPGTFLLNSDDQGIRWRLCDQILVSRELIDKIDGKPQILPKLLATKLLTAQGNPSRKYSDHLPSAALDGPIRPLYSRGRPPCGRAPRRDLPVHSPRGGTGRH